MAKEDYYNLLNLQRDATEDQIKKSYRSLAMKYHPDRNSGNTEEAEVKFKEIKEAYEVLSDSEKRAQYDRFGHNFNQQHQQHEQHGFHGMHDFFHNMFGGGHQQSQPQNGRGSDAAYRVEITLEEAIFGVEKPIDVVTEVTCGECEGTGAEKGSSPITCPTCNGHGQVIMQQGFFTIQQTCPACHGVGKKIVNHCRACAGQGTVNKSKTVSLKIPKGVDNGDRLKLHGQGNAGSNGAPFGDLYIDISVQAHNRFTREGTTLSVEIPISFSLACLGGELIVATLHGDVSLKIPQETQTGQIFKLSKKGATQTRSEGIGDLLCKVKIQTPTNLTDEQKQTIKLLNI